MSRIFLSALGLAHNRDGVQHVYALYTMHSLILILPYTYFIFVGTVINIFVSLAIFGKN